MKVNKLSAETNFKVGVFRDPVFCRTSRTMMVELSRPKKIKQSFVLFSLVDFVLN